VFLFVHFKDDGKHDNDMWQLEMCEGQENTKNGGLILNCVRLKN
jgi:hypothetical protein